MHKLNAPFARKQGGFSIPMLIGIIGLVGIIGLAAAKFTSGTKMNNTLSETKSSAATLQMQKGALAAALAQLQAGPMTGAWNDFGMDANTKTAALAVRGGAAVTSPGDGPAWPVGPLGADNAPITWKVANRLDSIGGMIYAFTSDNVSVDVCSKFNEGINGTAAPVDEADFSGGDWTETASGVSFSMDTVLTTAMRTFVADAACVKAPGMGKYRIIARLQ